MIKVINLTSLQRCGTHAIANWILHQNANIKSFVHPEHVQEDVYTVNDNAVLVNSFNVDDKRRVARQLAFASGICKSGTIVLAGESCSLDTYKMAFVKSKLEESFGNHIFINAMNLRSYKNFAASFYKKYRTVPPHMPGQWEQRANEYLGHTKYIIDAVYIKYDQWFSDKDYRKKICRALMLDFTDIGMDDVAAFGGGSSFTGLEGKASELDVLNRYKEFENDPGFKRHLLGSNVQLSEEIFGI